eukprot:2368974-Amphidinium_carterae.1
MGSENSSIHAATQIYGSHELSAQVQWVQGDTPLCLSVILQVLIKCSLCMQLLNLVVCLFVWVSRDYFLRSARYPSLKPLSSFFDDMLLRFEFFKDWIEHDQPISFWISAFYFPQGFLTSVLQAYSRSNMIPVDQLGFEYRMEAWLRRTRVLKVLTR